jgi:hypothetical protein
MRRIALLLVPFASPAGCTAKEARRDADQVVTGHAAPGTASSDPDARFREISGEAGPGLWPMPGAAAAVPRGARHCTIRTC